MGKKPSRYGRLCMIAGCWVRASYNFKEAKPPIFCRKHMISGMENINSKRCVYENCTKQPNFNYIGLKSRFCYEHKKPGMVDTAHKKCIIKNCEKRASYSIEYRKPMYCYEHMPL